MSEFYEGMAEVLEIDLEQVTSTFELKNIDWNSLAIVSTIALADECFDVLLNGRLLDACKTIGDIENLIAAKKD